MTKAMTTERSATKRRLDELVRLLRHADNARAECTAQEGPYTILGEAADAIVMLRILSENALTACSGVDCERCEAFERRAIAALELLRRWRDEARGRDLYDKTNDFLNAEPQVTGTVPPVAGPASGEPAAAAPSAPSAEAVTVFGPEQQDYPSGPVYRVGTSTGANLPEQPYAPSSAPLTGETPRTGLIYRLHNWCNEDHGGDIVEDAQGLMSEAAEAVCQIELELAEARANADDWMQRYGATQGHGTVSSEARTSPNGLWMVYYEDADAKPEIFFGEGAEAAARERYKHAKDNWSCHLLSRVPEAFVPSASSGMPEHPTGAMLALIAGEYDEPMRMNRQQALTVYNALRALVQQTNRTDRST